MHVPVFEYEVIRPLSKIGLTNLFWDIHIDTLAYTWIAMLSLVAIVVAGRFFLTKKMNAFSLLLEQAIMLFVNLCRESFGFFRYSYFSFIASLFIFIFFCNLVGSLPFIEEPTRDLNTALACGICGFLYVQYQAVRHAGIKEYIKEYFQPFFLLFPINFIGEFAKIASMSFRLFGNVLGGSIVLYILVDALSKYKEYFMAYAILVLISSWLLKKFLDMRKYEMLNQTLITLQMLLFSVAGAQIFFGAFEAVIQAFVLTMLVTTYLSIAVQGEDGDEEEFADLVSSSEEG
jgi:F-type H+-transporting ATPase subunit a